MQSWFDFWPTGCCSKRKTTNYTVSHSSPAFEQSLESLPEEISYSRIPFPTLQSPEKLPPEENYITPFFGKRSCSVNTSRRSTQDTIGPLESASLVLTQFNCASCLGKAESSCLGCPGKYYCLSCFANAHLKMRGPHKLIQFSIKSSLI